jgi:hypothetical protein
MPVKLPKVTIKHNLEASWILDYVFLSGKSFFSNSQEDLCELLGFRGTLLIPLTGRRLRHEVDLQIEACQWIPFLTELLFRSKSTGGMP